MSESMTLSDAIRLGAMLKPQEKGGSGLNGSCALRAAIDALGIDDHGALNYSALKQRYWFLWNYRSCPACSVEDETLAITYHLNDQHEWTREAIADWIATLEAQSDAPTDAELAPLTVRGVE